MIYARALYGNFKVKLIVIVYYLLSILSCEAPMIYARALYSNFKG